jgi:hypothetical protein
MLVWDWDPGPGHVQGDIDTFEVAMVGEGSAQSPEVGSAVQAFPVELPPCLEEMEYSVSAGIEGRAGSPWSEPYSSENPNCPEFARVEITLEGLQVDDLDDGCVLFCDGETLQAYGSGEWTVRDTNDESHYATATTAWMTFWTDGCHGGGPGGGCLFAPRTIRNTDYDLALEDIRTCQGGACSDLGPGNNSVRLTVYDGAAVEFRFEMWDSDTAEDDVWCGTIEDRGLLDYDAYALGQEYETAVMVIGPYSLREWAEFPYRQVEFLWSNSDEALSDHDADCTLTYSIRPLGLMYTTSR